MPAEGSMDSYLIGNLQRWNEITPLHVRSGFYNVEAFRQGKSSLKAVEVDELGDVAGKSLLHLQCHFGLDTLSWARLGARVTGVDFSDEAIRQAKALACEVGIAAEFIHANVLDLRDHLTGTFDVVFTSYGVLPWLPDLRPWGQVIGHFLKPNGTFYMVEAHPFAFVFEQKDEGSALSVDFSYFHEAYPLRYEVKGTYADRSARVEHATTYTWQHSLADILNALTSAGLRLEFLHEFPFCMFPMFPSMTLSSDGWWRLPGSRQLLPLLFSVKAVKNG
jgi:SAM-dependent methyltransferase